MPARSITAETILQSERTDICSPVREIHNGPSFTFGCER